MSGTIKITENYITQEIENEILALIPIKSRYGKGRNQILRWGIRQVYQDGWKGKIIPEVFDQFKKDMDFNQVTINEYMPGQLIPYHTDELNAGKTIPILSLLSETDINFRNSKEIISFKLPRFSLAIISDKLRTDFEHSVTAIEKRVSVVFRNIGR